MSLLHADQIAQIYAAAVEADGLKRMAEAARAIMNVDSAGLWLIEHGRIVDISVTADISESLPSYLAYYQTLDPWNGARPKLVNHASIGYELFDEAELVRTEFYNDFARHFGILRPVGIVVDVEPGLLATVSVNRTATTHLLTEADKPLMEEVGVHLRAALQLYRRFRAQGKISSFSANALDRVSFGMLVCEADGRVVQLNQAALAIAEQRAGLRIGASQESLAAEFPAETLRLRALIRSAAEGRGGAIHLNGAETARLAVLATPLPVSGRGAIQSNQLLLPSQVLLCLSRLDHAPGLSRAVLAQLFNLSRAQIELCVLLAAGLTFEEAAMQRDIAISTARTHFKAILSKTDTNNLRDLLRLLAVIPQIIG